MARDKTIWSVGGGKGGIGKSIATVNIGCALALDGNKVILVDADLGGANLHTYLGIKYPPRVLEDFLKGRAASLEEVAIPTPVKGLTLISGGGEFLGIANPQYYRKQKLIAHINKLEADYIIVDLGAGTSYNVLDFFAVSNQGIVVLVPEPAAIQNSYVFLKSFVYRRLTRVFSDNPDISALIKEATDPRSEGCVKTFSDLLERIAATDRGAAEQALMEIKRYRPKLLLNMAVSKADLRVIDAFKNAASTFLGLKIDYIGSLSSSPAVKAAARKMRPFMLEGSSGLEHREMKAVVSELLATSGLGPAEGPSRPGRGSAPGKPGSPGSPGSPPASPPRTSQSGEGPGAGGPREVFGFNDNVSHRDEIFHVQTEVQGGAGGAGEPGSVIETVVYHGGRVFFSKKTDWSEAKKENGHSVPGGGEGHSVPGGGGGATLREFASTQHRSAIAAIKLNRITLDGVSK